MALALLSYVYLQDFLSGRGRGSYQDHVQSTTSAHPAPAPVGGPVTAMSAAPSYLLGRGDGPVAQQGCSMTD